MTRFSRPREGGFVLLFALFLTIALGALGVAMMRGVPVRERIAGNVTDKQRALRAAEDALRYAEGWLVQERGVASVPCAGAIDARVSSLRVCTRPLTDPTRPPWPERIENLPLPGNQPDANGPSRSAIHIVEVGMARGGLDRVFQITAAGYGPAGATGTTAVAVLRSTLSLSTAARNLGAH
ncbi:pilus assembly PilX family protein [Cupriavidus plantarum]|uniref:pilus assembly PilX family protein n=1 Tax=Cupriavidus plantarum TaxID=942865 RepID=UPI0015CE22C5|nr:pilus assembly protein PilX [Cupriavidus plantarum]NYI00983.1 Tfp pilus assembly protein PilX [Cupriavidus plantarum]